MMRFCERREVEFLSCSLLGKILTRKRKVWSVCWILPLKAQLKMSQVTKNNTCIYFSSKRLVFLIKVGGFCILCFYWVGELIWNCWINQAGIEGCGWNPACAPGSAQAGVCRQNTWSPTAKVPLFLACACVFCLHSTPWWRREAQHTQPAWLVPVFPALAHRDSLPRDGHSVNSAFQKKVR